MKKSAFLAFAGTTLALTTAALAQPAVDLDLGTLSNPLVTGGTLAGFAAGQVKWVKFTIPAGNMTRAAGQYLDINTNGGTLSSTDSHMGLFNSAGAFLASNDDSGPGNYSQLSYGDTGPARAAEAATGNAVGAGGTFTGVNGADLPAGDYYLAVTGFGGNTYAAGWTVGTTHTATGDVAVRVSLGTDATPSNPTVVGSYTPAAYVLSGNSLHFKAVVVNGTFPASTYALPGSGVSVNGALIGAGAIALFDDGAHNDGAAGDNEWGNDVVVTSPQANYTLPITVTDDAARVGTGNMPALSVFGPAPSCPPGTGAVSFTGVNSASAAGGVNNTTIPAASLGWTSSNPLLGIHVSGRIQEVNTGTFAGEANFLVTFTDATTVTLDPFAASGGYTGFADVANYFLAIPAGHNVNDVASIQAFETFDDGTDTLVDSTWTNLCFSYDSQTSPTGVAAANPNSGIAGSVTLLTCNVTPGQGPVSTGITVTGNLTNIGGSASQVFLDDGLNGDLAAGDNIFSYNATIGAVGVGAQSIAISIADAQSRTGSASTSFNVTAAPSVFTDLGALTCGTADLAPTLASGEIKWYRFTSSAITASPSDWLDIYTTTASTLSSSDTELGLFDNSGALITADDDSGNGFYSALTFGSTVIRTDPDPVGPILDGFDGTLAGGTYWLAVVGYNAAFGAGWSVTTTSTATGDVSLHLSMSNASCASDPTGVGAGGTVNGCGGNVLATVAVTPGNTPPSTGITVNLDTTALGGGVVAMLDNGTGGDVTANDGTYSRALSIAGGADATFNLPFVVADAESRSSNGSLSVVRSATEIGDLPASAQAYYGVSGTTITGNIGGGTDVDMFAICVSDTANFEAGVNNGGAAFDTQLFLFNADGTGAAMNDDEPDLAGTLQSHMMINNSLQLTPDPIVLPAGGLYYLALSPYNRDPISSAVVTDTIWANTGGLANSFDETWTPNGVTPAAAIAGWTGTGNAGGAFTITMVGAATTCPADLSNNSLSAAPDCAVDINDLLYFLTAFEAGNADVDNGTGSGILDCATDINDLLFFLTHFEAGC